MRKKFLFLVAAAFVAAMSTPPSMSAQDYGADMKASSVITHAGVSLEFSDGENNFKSFEVDVAAAGEYYLGFWLLPARYADNTYTQFSVYVNGECVGKITPEEGNWQSSGLDGDERVYLAEGVSIIAVSVKSPDIPNVETCVLSGEIEESVVLSDDYNSYMECAVSGTMPILAEEYIHDSEHIDAVGLFFKPHVNLMYTFFKKQSYVKDQDVFISSASDIAHTMDVIFIGQYQSNVPIGGGVITNPNHPGIQPSMRFVYASSEEMQGLNYKFPSIKASNSSKQMATARIKIPKTGIYLVRIRTDNTAMVGIVDVNFNGGAYYEDLPISYSYVSCEIPADGIEYASMTNCDNPGVDDPMIFIHRQHDDKVVGYNDDGEPSKNREYNLSRYDSYISQTYRYKTFKISVSSAFSSKPFSRCDILARVAVDDVQSVSKAIMKSKKIDNNISSAQSIYSYNEGICDVIYLRQEQLLRISADSEISTVSIYDVAGKLIEKISQSGNELILSVSELNISGGVYIIQVETIEGKHSQKIILP